MKKARLLALFGSVFLVLALLVTLTGGLLPAMAKKSQDELPPGIEKQIEAVESEISFAGEVPLNPSVNPVVVLSGSDYDMGYQYAQQVIQIYGPWILEEVQRDFTRDEIAVLKAYQWSIKEYTPEFIDWLKGMADGATDAGVELSYEEALASFCGVRAHPGMEPPGSEDDKLPPHDCSGFAVWGSATTDGSLIAAGSGDGGIRVGGCVIVAFPETGNNYMMSSGGMGFPGINNKGLALVHHGAGVNGDEGPGYAVPGAFMVRHTVRFADNAAEAVAMQLSYPNGNRGSAGGLWADVGGGGFDIECRDPEVVRIAGDHGEEDFLYASNSILTEWMGPDNLGAGEGYMRGWPLNYFPHGGWNMDDMNSVRRDLMMWNALHNYHGEVDLDFVKMMWRMPGPAPDYPTLEEAEEQCDLTHGEGWDTYIGSLGNGHIGIVIPDDGDEGLYYACVRNAGRQVEPLTQEYYYFQIAPTYTFYEMQLAADPAAVVSAAKKRSQYDLYYANKELRKLTYADVAYAPLDELFNKAATESQVGEYYLGLARSAQGNESMNNYAKALRAFTRCQAYAKQVYQSLVPPADDPEDLGLDEWFGGWGEWETAPDGDDDSGNP